MGQLTAEGHRHAGLGENAEALSCFIEALDLVPEPRGDHEATQAIFHGLRRVLQSRGDLGEGIELLEDSLHRVGVEAAELLSPRHGEEESLFAVGV